MDESDAKSPGSPGYSVTRPILQTIELQNESGYTRKCNQFSLSNWWSSLSMLSILHNLLPITEWLPRYDLKNDLIGDLISGFTVAVMHIPQGMAYGILGMVTPEVGLYMAFFPVLVYILLGTSRHASLGTFAVISLMVSSTVQSTPKWGPHGELTSLEVVTALCLMVGLIHLVMFVCRMGALSTLLNEPLVSGFTTGAAVHVFVNQLKDILGVKVDRNSGAFKIIYSVRDLISKVGEANGTALLISGVLIVIMVFNNEVLKPRVAKKCRFPIPIELMAVIGGTLLSRFVDLGVQLVGPIPTGLPAPQIPPLYLLLQVAKDALMIAIVSYSVLMSMAKTFAQKHKYEVRPNQELLAMGLANIVGSLFSCMPTGCALARSVIQEQTGGKTQIASLVSAILILLVILFIGPVFEVLPRCVLSSIIVVALKAMLFQIFNVARFRRQDIFEAVTWIVTFLTVVLIDIDVGLVCGVIMALITLYCRGLKSHSCKLGVLPGTGIYVDLKCHENSRSVPGVEIFRYSGGINFTSSVGMKRKMYEEVGVGGLLKRKSGVGRGTREEEKLNESEIKAVIFDVSCVPRMDFPASKTFLAIKRELMGVGVEFLIAGANDRVFDVLMHVFLMEREQIDLFVSVHDAVLSVQRDEEMEV